MLRMDTLAQIELSHGWWLTSVTSALLIGGLIGFLSRAGAIARARTEASNTAEQAQLRQQDLENRLQQAQTQLDERSERISRLQAELASARTELQEQRRSADEKLQLLTEAREALTVQFKQLSNEILEEKSKRFSEQNRDGLQQILEPLAQRIGRFEKQVAQAYDNENRDRATLVEQIRNLQSLNQQVAEDAKNLTTALRGESKTQGNWGELILERILESSGLARGREYEREVAVEGGRKRPDAIVRLPEGRDLIIDSKVSLSAYLNACDAQTDTAREAAIKEHVASVRRHIQGLSAKDYQHIESLRSPDFVLMFVPSEAAYIEAIRAEPRLQEEAIARNIGLVSPSTLLPTLRTVEYLWRVDRQNRNAQEIARQAGKLYDKFVGFEADLSKLGDRLRLTRESFDDAYSKLSTGRGNLVRSTERLRKLGAASSKALDRELTERAHGESGEAPDSSKARAEALQDSGDSPA